MDLDKLKLPFLSDENHYAIAQVAARSATLEHMVQLTISSLLSWQDETAEFLLKSLSSDRLVGLLEALLRERFPYEKEEISAWSVRIKKSPK